MSYGPAFGATRAPDFAGGSSQRRAADASSVLIQSAPITTASVADPFANDRSAHLFTMSDGNRVLIYYDGATINYRIETNGVWGPPTPHVIGCCGTGGGLARSVWTRNGDTLYGASGSPTDFIFYWKFAYANGVITDSRGGIGHGGGGTGNPAGIYYDATNDLVHVAYRFDGCCGLDGTIHAVDPATLGDVYSAVLAYMPPPAAIDNGTALAGGGSNTFYWGGASGTQFTITQFVAGPSSYTQTVETGEPALAAPATAGSLVWDGSTLLYIVNESDAKFRLYTRLGANSYRLDDLLTTPLGPATHPAVTRKSGTGDLAVFYRDDATQANGEIKYLSRTSGIWNAPLTLAGGAATGWAHVSAAADDQNSLGVARVVYVTGTASPFTLTEDSVAGVDPTTRPDAGSVHTFDFGAGIDAAVSADPVNLGTGSLTVHADDLSLPGRVLPLVFTRWYTSADPTGGPLGTGWTHSYNWKITENATVATVRRGDGRQDTFTRNPDGTYTHPPGVFDVLVKNPDGTYTLTLPSQVIHEFSASGQLSRIREPAGNQVTFAYTGASLTGITDTVGRQLSLSYVSDRLSQIQDPLGRKVTYAYDASGRLTTVTDKIGNAPGQTPSQHQWTYAYDGLSRHIRTITDPDGRVRVTNTYDDQGRVTQQRDGSAALTTISYSSGQTVLTDPRGHATTHTFDDRLRVLTQSDVVGTNPYTISYTYDTTGNRTSVTDRRGNRTDFTYDSRGNVLTKTDPSPSIGAPRPATTFTYDAKNNLTQITDPLGSATDLAYDGTTNVLLSVSRQIDATTFATTKYEYGDPANPGLPTRVIAPRGNTTGAPDYTFATTLAYDAQGNLTSRTDPDAARTTFTYDAAGRLVSFVDPDGKAVGGVPAQHTWTIAYDANDRETSRTDPLGHALSYNYDGVGQRIGLTDRNGNLTFYTYDANARLATVRQQPDPFAPLTYTTTVTRDANGNATRITQANDVTTDYAFDALDRLTAVTIHPTPTTSLTTSYVLDGSGQPTSRTTGDGVTVAYAYDALSRLTAVSGPGLTIGYAYDAAGRRTSMTDATGTTTYQYDGLGRVTSVAAPGGTLGYVYDRDGNRTTLAYPGGQSVAYAYSPGGRMASVTDWAARTSAYTYTASGLVSRLTYPNGLAATYGYDRAQRLVDLQYTATGGTLTFASQHFTLDAEGDRTALDESVLLQTNPPTLATDHYAMSYDGLLRLTALSGALFGGTTSSETFGYDAATNLSARTGPAAAYTMDSSNRVTSDGTRAFTWDGADRLTARGADTFGYDVLGRMTASTIAGVPAPVTRTYAYDGDGLLRSRTEGTSTTSYLWDASTAPAPLLVAGTDRVVHGLGPLYLVRQNDRTLTLVRDALGSVRAEVTDQGVITKAFRYAAYGEIVQPNANTPTLLGFAGELRDPSGLIYLRARWYDPGTGRFMSRDPLLGDARAPVSMNRYAYAGANPIRNADPTGLWCSGGLGSLTLAMGLWVAPGGAATMSGIGFGYCHDELTGANQLGWFKYGGKFSSQDDIQRTIGLYAGIGAGVWWSPNAQSFADIAGPFLTGSIGTAVTPEIQYSIGKNGIEMYSGTLGPGLILEYTILITNTEILGTINLGPSAPVASKGW